jgi:nucleoside-diphosphate-sugar epimerase
MKILVTGSNGFIGGAVARALQLRGDDVMGLGRHAQAKTPVHQYIVHDLVNPLPSMNAVDAVIHCAALSAPWARPAAFEAANVAGTQHVMEYCRRLGISRLIYISSSSVYYKREDQFQITEQTPIPNLNQQINHYSRTKRMAEMQVKEFPGIWTILRPRAVFGPGDTVLFPRILRAAQAGRLPLLRRSDGKPVIGDLIYIDTLVAYILRALDGQVAGEINLTNNEPVNLHDFLRQILATLGYPALRREVPVALAMALARAAEWISASMQNYREPPITRFGISVFAWSKTFDVSKALHLLGSPEVGIDEGVKRFVAWWGDTSHA